MSLFLNGEYRVTQRAAFVLRFCAENHPALVEPYWDELISNLEKTVPAAVKRNTVRYLQQACIPTHLQGQLADICFNYLIGSEPIAIKAFAMTVLANLAKTEPDLANELKIIIQDQMPHASPGFLARARRVLREFPPALRVNNQHF